MSRLAGDDALILQHTPLVRRLAFHLLAKLPASVAVDDLIQVGMLGLLDAIAHFQADQGAQFETYATVRIRGAMLDELRQQDWLPRRSRHKARQVEKTIQQMEQQLGRPASAEEIATALDLSVSEYHDILNEVRTAQVLSWEDLQGDCHSDHWDPQLADTRSNPYQALEQTHFHLDLSGAITRLPAREQLVLSLYYQEELNLREIGAVLEVSESRVSQLLSQATLRLRASMQGWIEPNAARHILAKAKPARPAI